MLVKSTIFRNAVVLITAMVILPALVFGQVHSAESKVWDGPEPVVENRQPRAIKLNLPFDALYQNANQVVTPCLDVEKLILEDSTSDVGSLRIGIRQSFPAITADNGIWTKLPDNGWLWTMSFKAEGATGIDLCFSPWEPPSGSELIVYNPHDNTQSVGPFTRTRPGVSQYYYTPTIYSDEVCLEFYLPSDGARRAFISWIKLDAMVNIYRNDAAKSPDSELECHPDVADYPEWLVEACGVGRVKIYTDYNTFLCTGALLNREPGDWTPLFLTTSRSGWDNSNFNFAEVLWLYQKDESGALPDPNDDQLITYGTTLLYYGMDSNWGGVTLLGLNSDIPPGTTYLGWSAGWWNPNYGAPATAIHHPQGSYKRIAFGHGYTMDSTSDNYHIIFYMNDGLLEEGSFGAPMFGGTQIIGTATWEESHPAYCNSDNVILQMPFSYSYNNIHAYLSPVDPVYVDGGYSGHEDGTAGMPFDRLAEGTFAVRRGSTLFVKAGTYDERLRIDKAMVIRGTY